MRLPSVGSLCDDKNRAIVENKPCAPPECGPWYYAFGFTCTLLLENWTPLVAGSNIGASGIDKEIYISRCKLNYFKNHMYYVCNTYNSIFYSTLHLYV